MSSTELGENFLAHYGVMGMHWGIRKKSDVNSGSSGLTDKQKKILGIAGKAALVSLAAGAAVLPIVLEARGGDQVTRIAKEGVRQRELFWSKAGTAQGLMSHKIDQINAARQAGGINMSQSRRLTRLQYRNHIRRLEQIAKDLNVSPTMVGLHDYAKGYGVRPKFF